MTHAPGSITLMGSGETSASGGQVFEALARKLPDPLTIAILETPAGFEVNATRVAGRVAEFLQQRLQNYHPQIHLIPARKKGTPLSPDEPEVVRPLYDSDLIFFGPGSPTYTVRQLQDSLAWQIVQARHRLGASLALASAAIISAGSLALPVYEIYKVGEDPHWKPGLDLFEPFGLKLVIVPHWNNREGGDELDTSRCFMGQERFEALQKMIPPEMTLLGLDEHTSLTIDFESETCLVWGTGMVHILRNGATQECPAGCSFSIFDLGSYRPLPSLDRGLPKAVWQAALKAEQARKNQREAAKTVPAEVQRLVEDRQEARRVKDWARADELRGQIASLGWSVKDTPSGPVVEPDSE